MNFDYSPLTAPISSADRHEYTRQYPAQLNLSAVIAAISVSVVAIGIVIALAYKGFTETPAVLWGAGVVGVFVAFGLTLAVADIYARKRRRIRLFKFAKANAMELVIDRSEPGYEGMVFAPGHTHRIREALQLPDGREIGRYEYVTGSGSERQTTSWMYMRVKLVRKLPHMVLDAKKNNAFGGLRSNLPASLKPNQALRLEGNFNDYFTVYVPNGYETDALYVFTPDVMAALIDNGADFDIEVIDDTLYFYSHRIFRLDQADRLQQLFTVMGTISAEIIDQGDYYADSRVGDRTMNVIADPGRRLKRGIGIVTTCIIIILVILFQALDAFTR